MIQPTTRDGEEVRFAWFFTFLGEGRAFHYGTPMICHPATAARCLCELAADGRFPSKDLAWDGVWFDIGLLPPADLAPPADCYDAFAPIPHPATGNLMAVLLRVRPKG